MLDITLARPGISGTLDRRVLHAILSPGQAEQNILGGLRSLVAGRVTIDLWKVAVQR